MGGWGLPYPVESSLLRVIILQLRIVSTPQRRPIYPVGGPHRGDYEASLKPQGLSRNGLSIRRDHCLDLWDQLNLNGDPKSSTRFIRPKPFSTRREFIAH